MSELQVRHVATMLKQRYSDKIDVSDCLTTREEDYNNLFLTRAYAAYSLQVIADVPIWHSCKYPWLIFVV